MPLLIQLNGETDPLLVLPNTAHLTSGLLRRASPFTSRGDAYPAGPSCETASLCLHMAFNYSPSRSVIIISRPIFTHSDTLRSSRVAPLRAVDQRWMVHARNWGRRRRGLNEEQLGDDEKGGPWLIGSVPAALTMHRRAALKKAEPVIEEGMG